MKNKLWSKAKYYMQLFDGLWSFPLAVALFVGSGTLMYLIFGPGVGSYDPGFIQPFLLAVAIVAGAATATNIGTWFNFRTLFRYLYGKDHLNGGPTNNSKIDFNNLAPWQRLVLSLLVYFAYFFSIIYVYLKFV